LRGPYGRTAGKRTGGRPGRALTGGTLMELGVIRHMKEVRAAERQRENRGGKWREEKAVAVFPKHYHI